MIEVLSVQNMRASDRKTIEGGITGTELMQRAAEGIYDAIKDHPEGGEILNRQKNRNNPGILIVCGSGNNAGDGFALGQILVNNGLACEILLLEERFSDDGRFFYEKCLSLNIPIGNRVPNINEYDIIVDCIFGTGFHGEVFEPQKSVIESINKSKAFVVSADINSGLNGNSGRIEEGSVCVNSDLTVSIGSYKPGHFLSDAQDVIGTKVNCDIGISPVEEPYFLLQAQDAASVLKPRKHNSHKGKYGYIALVGGSLKYSGAVKLANLAQSAMASGAGVVKLAVPKVISQSVLPYLLESTLFVLSDNGEEVIYDEGELSQLVCGVSTIAVGIGIGASKEVERILEYLFDNFDGNLIIDADGLNALAKRLDILERKRKPQNVIITPHPKEFSRLCGEDIKTLLNNPCHIAKEFAVKYNVTVLLKGNTTVISDGKNIFLSDTGTAGMATAGSGDVLCGVIAALVAFATLNDMGSIPVKEEGKIAFVSAAAAYITGIAGMLAAEDETDISMTASDTVSHIKKAIKYLVDKQYA